ncbi:acylneuraminate cytidylyltransferase family protein [Pseudomonas farsensis]|uniref:Acylneuraminate cytidylyltransferase family protein n=1 Tax=Pseudomonas farsensis TaxID=2745492 RepID=A0ABU8QTZ9_9PSED
MKILAVVPARGGSKRVPGKNIKLLGGRPLINWTLKCAQDSQALCAVMVSTDDPRTAEIATQAGAWVPGLRPAELATDTATSVDVVLHALDCYESQHGALDGVMLLQPTSPFRSSESIRRAVSLFKANSSCPVLSVCAAVSHPAWCFKIHGDSLEPFLGWESFGARSQDLEPAYVLNGSIYLISPSMLRSQRRVILPGAVPLVMDGGVESLDIDTFEDWQEAELAVNAARSENGV